MKSSHVPAQPCCLLAHTLLNQLSVILAECDLLRWEGPGDADLPHRLESIRATAKGMGNAIVQHECHLSDLTRQKLTNVALLSYGSAEDARR